MHKALAEYASCALTALVWGGSHRERASSPLQKLVCAAAQVLATDGLWEVMSNAEVVAFVEAYRTVSHEAMSAADALSWEAHRRWNAGGEQVRRGLG